MTKQSWVKKLISKSQWNNWYSKNSSYCKLKEDIEGLWIGFLVADYVPDGCLAMTDYELIQVNDYRRAYNISPFPLEDIKVEEVKVKQSTIDALDKLRNHIKGLSNKMGVEPISKTEEPISEPLPEKATEDELSEDDKKIIQDIPF